MRVAGRVAGAGASPGTPTDALSRRIARGALAVALPAARSFASAGAPAGTVTGQAGRLAPGDDLPGVHLYLAGAGATCLYVEIGVALGRLDRNTDYRAHAKHRVDACTDRIASHTRGFARFVFLGCELCWSHAEILPDAAASLGGFCFHLRGHLHEVSRRSDECTYLDVRPRIRRKA
jgi:hypothetical protein